MSMSSSARLPVLTLTPSVAPTSSQQPIAGDLVFFAADPHSLADRLVAWRTRSPYVHCEIVVGDGTESIAALSRGGVVRHALPSAPPVAAWAQTGARCLPDRLPGALDWLAAQVRARDGYAWPGIGDDALSLVLPRGPFVFLRRTYTCSQLAAVFLLAAGYWPLPPSPFLTAPQLVTPGDLAHALAHLTTPVVPGTAW